MEGKVAIDPNAPVPDAPLPPEIIRYEEKIKAVFALAILATLAGLSILWTYHKAELPPEMVGIIIGSLTTGIGAIVQAMWSRHSQQQPPPNA